MGSLERRILIADGGATKISWALVGKDETRRCETRGLNASLCATHDLSNLFSEARCALDVASRGVDAIYYYGAGCRPESLCREIEGVLGETFGCTQVTVESDLLGACRALLGHRPGIACILGTGSNSCRYDGERIAEHVPSLGFILGDEGSGARLGIRLLSDIFKGELDAELRRKFQERYHLSEDALIEATYRQPRPSAYLASYVPFLSENSSHPDVHRLVAEEFRRFLERNVAHYSDCRTLPIAFVGGVAAHFQAQLQEAVEEAGMIMGRVMAAPLDGLIDYHTECQ